MLYCNYYQSAVLSIYVHPSYPSNKEDPAPEAIRILHTKL